MKLTLFINPEHPPGDDFSRRFAEHREQVRVARAAGYDGLAVGHHLSYGSAAWFPPLETLMGLVEAAEGMQLATCMLILPLFHPLHVAQQAALLDVMSGGRLTLGVAPGWQEDEFRVLGVDHGRRLGRYLEALDLIRRLWTEERVDFAGRHFSAEALSLALKPVRKPRPPIWFGGSVAKAVARAGRLADTALGDSWVASSHLKRDVIVRQTGVFRAALEAHGKSFPAEFPILRNIVVAKDRATAIADAGPFLAASYKLFGQWGLFTGVADEGKQQLALEELLADRIIIGSPDDCAEALADLARHTGANRLIARVQWLGMDQSFVLRTIEMLAGEVMPMVRRALA